MEPPCLDGILSLLAKSAPGLRNQIHLRQYNHPGAPMSESRSLPIFDTLLQDLRYTFRTLRRDAGFTAFAVLIVGLGIGASATVFSVVNTLLLRELPFREPESLAWIANHDVSGLSGQTTQVGHMLDLRERSRSFSDIAGYFAF